MAILKKLRRSSKDSGANVQAGVREDTFATQPSCPEAKNAGKLTFFDLAPELRNVVYELVATSTTLFLPARKKYDKSPLQVSGLLLVSKQCRKEYLPLLYSTVPVIVEVKDFDFRKLMRVVSSLYSTELKALRENRRLIIRLNTHNCTRENLSNLRQWLVNRADGLDRLPWRYEIAVTDANFAAGRYRLLRELMRFYAERLSRLQVRLEDTLQWELQAIVAAFDGMAARLENALDEHGVDADASASLRSQARGLPGGGVR